MAIDSKNLLVWVKAMSRGQPLPLDATEVYESMAEAEEYLTSGIAYAGQTVKIKLDNGLYREYIIQQSDDAGYYLDDTGDESGSALTDKEIDELSAFLAIGGLACDPVLTCTSTMTDPESPADMHEYKHRINLIIEGIDPSLVQVVEIGSATSHASAGYNYSYEEVDTTVSDGVIIAEKEYLSDSPNSYESFSSKVTYTDLRGKIQIITKGATTA